MRTVLLLVFCSSVVACLCLAIIAAADIVVANVSYMTAGGIHLFSSHFLSRTAVTVKAYKGRCMGSLLRFFSLSHTNNLGNPLLAVGAAQG
ncbi:uncharacterized protein LY79DRAFT_536788 [Colletotrichum navitas]|uniref:Secreted protein n=1 Tax=Colletotrichum navitas TaxID=681940 RepID=A0AAD8QAG6_9PEZI|nr:uncharacterized protein LY79DRAFT_536788 [Colletotrichum navitas]KAK1599056.1 hypothetical protein LY79DRAFT_536788 [Colletotrichum navitas]